MKTYDHIIIGSGISALQLATHVHKKTKVLIVTKSTVTNSNSYRAQGGIAAAVSKEDNPFFHFQDTLRAGCLFHDNASVYELVHNGPRVIKNLNHDGLFFDKDGEGNFSLGMEGAHSHHRILHCGGDATGKHMVEHLLSKVQPHVDVIENEFVFELIIDSKTKRCIGIKSMDEHGKLHRYFGTNIVLAVGGIGGLFSYTSNDPSVTGDGIALAYRAGADIIDMEFIQFHPTLLFTDNETRGLISEAVRGLGARLVNTSGTHFMDGKHPQGDLAPRHIVAKEIFKQRAAGKNVFLDVSMIDDFKEAFPTVSAICNANGVSIEEGFLPVAPGSHFLMGGIAVNEFGETSIKGLFAIGEVASTGVHGANRLASNSLLEGLYFGEKLANHLNEKQRFDAFPTFDVKKEVPYKQLELPTSEDIKNRMMAQAGIIRTKEELIELDQWLNSFSQIDSTLDGFQREEIQVVFMLQVAKLIVTGALLRKESRGGHIREDFPHEGDSWKKVHIVQSRTGVEMRRKTNERHQAEIHA
ncbi:L-aspartate oxidase [Sporosarcina sp. CAU 1771]